MDVLTYTETRANLKDVMDRVVRDRAPILIARKNGQSVVIISLADWEAMEETDYLLASPVNARRLREGIAELNAGKGKERQLIEPGAPQKKRRAR